MTLTLTIYKDNEKVNELKCSGKNAYITLINLLFEKQNKGGLQKITITPNYTPGTLNATKTFEHILFDNKIAKYKYLYNFKNVDNTIFAK